MSDRFRRISEQLDGSFARLGVPAATSTTEDGVVIRWSDVQRLRSVMSSIEGGSHLPFIHALLRSAPHTPVVLRGDEPHHLRRALEDLKRQKTRNEQLDRGQIPGALSGSEVARLIRRRPELFAGAHRKGKP